jgi:hypothetical protein
MKSKMNGMVLTVLAASLLAACGGGGGGSAPAAAGGTTTTPPPGAPAAAAPTAATASALVSIQVQLTAFQAKFATTLPLANDPVLLGMLDATFMNDGDNGATFVTSNVTAPTSLPIGFTFGTAIGVNSLDVAAVANDATHQWFATAISFGGQSQYITMLAIKNAATGQWLLAGNQRMTGVNASAFAQQLISSPPPVTVPATPAIPTSIQTGMSLGLMMNGQAGSPAADTAILAKGVASATVSGPGVIGATAGVLGPVTIFASVVPVGGFAAGTQWIQSCGLPANAPVGMIAVTTNCVDMTKVVPGTYSFNILGTDPVTAAAFNVTYNEAVKFAYPATLTAANFPVINAATTPKTGFTSGATVTVNWTVPAAQTAANVYLFEMMGLFNLNIPAIGAAGATINTNATLPVFPAASVVGIYDVMATSYDANGLYYTTVKQY